ncbi:hypothetical protein D3C78_1848070 [compost metagenome]
MDTGIEFLAYVLLHVAARQLSGTLDIEVAPLSSQLRILVLNPHLEVLGASLQVRHLGR